MRTILVVEGGLEARVALERALAAEGCRCRTITPDAKSLRGPREEAADVILFDVGSAAEEALRGLGRLEFEPELRLIPVVMLTSAPFHPERGVGGLEPGSAEFFAKPFQLDAVVSRLRSLLGRPSFSLDAPASKKG